MSHSAYRVYIAHYLITTSLETVACIKNQPPVPIDNTEMRLSGKHFVSNLTLLFGPRGKHLLESAKFGILHANNMHFTATMIYTCLTSTLNMDVKLALI